MDIESRKKRLKDAINYLASIGVIDGMSTTKAIAADMGRNCGNIGAARAGSKRYLTKKFVKELCNQYNNIISPDWIWDGVGVMVTSSPKEMDSQLSSVDFMSLSKEKLVSVINELISIHNRQQEIIIKEQERFVKLINEISSEVSLMNTRSRIDDILSNPDFFTYLIDAIDKSGNKQMKKALKGTDKERKEKILRTAFDEMPQSEKDSMFAKILDKFDSIDVISESDK